jgi:hypothetical protein
MRYQWRGLPGLRKRPAYYERRSLPAAVIPLFVAVAIVGYLAGHARSGGESGEAARTAQSAHVLIEYPSGWRPVKSSTTIPGLPIAHPQLIVPRVRDVSAGLLVGTLPAGELGPLPRQFVERLHGLPKTTVVDLVEGQAYKYTQFSGTGLNEPLTVFVIPNPGGNPTALACYAPGQTSVYMRECEETVAGVTLVAQSQVYQLAPEPGYAADLSAAISSLDGLRVALKRELHPQISAERAQELAAQLSEGFAQAAASLGKLEPSAAVVPLQAALAAAIGHARDAYRELAAAAGQRDASAYTAAQKRISAAEAEVDRALENFVLLGYSPALGAASAAKF